MNPAELDFAADARSHVNLFLIPKYTNNMPLRLVDTYTGLILEQSEIVSLLQRRRDYLAKLEAAVKEAEHLATPIDPECLSQHPKLDHLDTFIAEYLAFAMFSHRWRGREPTLDDVRKAHRGIYSMDSKDLVEENPKVTRPPMNEVNDLPSGVEKLQEFCCLAAKCGFRWAWTDTCCINKKDPAETSESINCMFLWYRTSDLTIVYLDDVDEVEEGRLLVVDGEDGNRWFEDPEIRKSFLPPYPSETQTSSDTYVPTPPTEPSLSLYDRLRDETSPQLRSMQPDTQVERPHLETHLMNNFPEVQGNEVSGKRRKLPVWVTRGWTLQEMLASKRLRFYSKRWTLLEEADDRDTVKAEEKISISSFRFRARLMDHRANDLWGEALKRTTDVPMEDLVDFKVGAKDVKSRLSWAARRTTTKVEDMAYCLIGIFDISLPVIYGERHRAFFRLQEEIMKRTGDVSLFDWCGRNSCVNSFLAYSPECFIASESNSPNLDLDVSTDPSDSTFRMIVKALRLIFGVAWSGIKTVAHSAMNWINHVIQSLPPGHTLVNGGLNIPLFEHQVKSCKVAESSAPGHHPHCYILEIDGLLPTTVTLASPTPGLKNNPTQYYLCRPWNWDIQNMFNILSELLTYVFQEAWNASWHDLSKDERESSSDEQELSRDEGELETDEGELSNEKGESGRSSLKDEDNPESKLQQEVQQKRNEVLRFFRSGFPVYLIHVKDRRRIRINTLHRVVAAYSEKFDFTTHVVTRLVL